MIDVSVYISDFDLEHNTLDIIQEFVAYVEGGISNDVLVIYGNNFEYYEISNDEDNKLLICKDFIRIIYENDRGCDGVVLINNKDISAFELRDMIE